jgi:hypothetical protein
MGMNRSELFKILNQPTDSLSLVNWNNLNNFYVNHKKDLEYRDVVELCEKCEKYRVFWNTDRMTTIQIVKNGKVSSLKRPVPGLGIERNDVAPKPNNIYKHLEKMEMDIAMKLRNVGVHQNNYPAVILDLVAV